MRDSSDHRQLHTPTSQDISLHDSGRVKVDSNPPVILNIRPVIESHSFTEHTYGLITNLAPAMSTALMESLKTFASLSRFATLSNSGSRRCAERYLADRETFWTLENPGHYTCKTCFNRKQPCMRSTGTHQWIVLPLPPAMRDTGVVWHDKANYIYRHEGSSMRYPGVWRVDPHKGRGTKREQE